jgi:serine/threonine-protein kinase
MATVYVARDTRLQRTVALKLLSVQSGGTSDVFDRFLHEALALASLRGPHVTRILDYGRLQTASMPVTPYIVMELLQGVDLRSAIRSNTRLSTAVAADYLIEACEGLAEAHGQGIVHRDIKPDNLFLALETDGTMAIKLLDFGISKKSVPVASGPVTLGTEWFGTPRYMSPEQMTALPVDARSDIWALGTVLFECVTGKPAFSGATAFEIGAQVLLAPMPDWRRLHPELDADLVNIVERCLRRKPEHRYQTVAELAEALEPLTSRHEASSSERIGCMLRDSPAERTMISLGAESVRLTRHESGNAPAPKVSHSRYGWLRTLILIAVVFSIGYLTARPRKELSNFGLDPRNGAQLLCDMLLH